MWRRASWHRWAQSAVLLCGLCCAAFAGCLFMSAGVPSEVTWPPPPSPVAPQEPMAARSQSSAVIQASGDARGPVQGMMGEGCQPLGCHWQRCGCGVTGAAVTVIVTLWTQGETDVSGGRSPGDCLQAFWCPEEAGGQQALSPNTDPRGGGRGDPRGCCVRSRSGPSPGVMSRGQSVCRAPSGALVL